MSDFVFFFFRNTNSYRPLLIFWMIASRKRFSVMRNGFRQETPGFSVGETDPPVTSHLFSSIELHPEIPLKVRLRKIFLHTQKERPKRDRLVNSCAVLLRDLRSLPADFNCDFLHCFTSLFGWIMISIPGVRHASCASLRWFSTCVR